uniref:RING-type E3 ubiquitin transferase n=1 Tax=Elaeophora elaphi TaxID=1147741 RepID=A0A0R3S3J8_9BILA
MPQSRVVAKRSSCTVNHQASDNEYTRQQPTNSSRRDMARNFGRGGGRIQQPYQRDGPNNGFKNTSNGRDEHGVKPRKHTISSSKCENRSDHGGIKFRGEVSECDICCRQSDVFAIGPCLHPICIECGIRLRILCKNETCPKCRAIIDVLYIVPFPGDWSDYQIPLQYTEHKDAAKHKVKLADDYVASCYDSYLSHQCLICEKKGEKRIFETFARLNQHVYMVHRFEFCDICVENLNLFTHERKFYSQSNLKRHLEQGDSDDKSFKGHPKCLFCEKRFLDEEFRYKHLRKEHFFCQICDTEGRSNYFFPEHKDLLNHYRAKHVICEEGECLRLGIAFRTDTELKLHKSRDHAAGPQVLTLDFHFSDRNIAGPSRGGRVVQSARSTFSSKQNIPKTGLVPHKQPLRENKPVSNNVSIVSSTAEEPNGSSFPYCLPQFTLQGSDFPRLGKSVRNPEASNSVPSSQGNKSVAKPQEVTAENTARTVSNSSEPNTVSSKSWFIDDDEQFPPHQPHPSTLNKQQSQNRNAENPIKDKIEIEGSSGTSVIESSWSKAMKKPMSLSNVASALASSDFPSLPASAVAKPVKDLLPGSVWAKKSRSIMLAPSRQLNLSSSFSSTCNNSRKSKQLPVPDLWPQKSISEKSEDREDPSALGSLSKMTLEDMIIVKNASNKKKESKKNKDKQQHNFVRKLDHQLSEGKKRKMEDKTADEFVDPFPSLSSHIHQEHKTEEACVTKPSFNLSELLSSTFSTLNNVTTKNESMPEEMTAESSVNQATIDVSSVETFLELDEGLDRKVSRKQSEITGKHLPLGIGLPPGLSSMNLAPPPGFGPPPGFDNTVCPEMQISTKNSVKSSDRNIDLNQPKSAKHSDKE